MSLAMKRAVAGCVCLAALAAVVRADGPGSFPQSGILQVTKNCTGYEGGAGDVCTITSSNVKEIEVGTEIVYGSAMDFSTLTLDSDVVLNVPGPGNNTAFGHCQVNLATGFGLCTFSSGTGRFTHFEGNANVSPLGGLNFAWGGTYTFDPRD